MSVVFPEAWGLKRIYTAKVALKVTQGHWHWYHSISHIVFHCNYVSIFYHSQDTVSYFQNFKEITWPQTHPLWGNLPHACKYSSMSILKIKPEVSSFTHSKDTTAPPPGLSCGIMWVILSLAILVQYHLVTDKRSQDHSIHRTSIAYHGKNSTTYFNANLSCTVHETKIKFSTLLWVHGWNDSLLLSLLMEVISAHREPNKK